METMIIIIVSYLIGSVMTGYFVSTMLAGQDIRKMGSQNVGARNAGTLYGRKAFLLTAIGDGLKGLLAVLFVRLLGFSIELQAVALLFVLIGHLLPVFLKFHGGKGIATFIGALLIFNSEIFLYFFAVFIVIVIISRSATIAVMMAFVFIPFITFYVSSGIVVPLLISFAVILLLWASRKNIIEKIQS
jgi:acyl phosphate:glycerol-3-phosphate acyltransferase